MSNEPEKIINWDLEKQAANEFIGLLQSSIDLVNKNKQKNNSKKNQKLKILLQDLSFLAHQAENEYEKYKTKNKQKKGRRMVANANWSTKEQDVKDKKRSIDNIILSMKEEIIPSDQKAIDAFNDLLSSPDNNHKAIETQAPPSNEDAIKAFNSLLK